MDDGGRRPPDVRTGLRSQQPDLQYGSDIHVQRTMADGMENSGGYESRENKAADTKYAVGVGGDGCGPVGDNVQWQFFGFRSRIGFVYPIAFGFVERNRL